MTALTISGSVAFGMVLALLGHLKLALARRPEHVTGKVDLLLFLLNFALIPMMLAAGLLVDFWGVGRTLLTGSIVLALAFLALSAGPAYTRSLIAVTAAALGASAVGVASLVLMPQGLFGVEQITASLHLGLVLVSLAALLTPPLIDLLLRGVGFGRTMAITALLMLGRLSSCGWRATSCPRRRQTPPAWGRSSAFMACGWLAWSSFATRRWKGSSASGPRRF